MTNCDIGEEKELTEALQIAIIKGNINKVRYINKKLREV